MKAVILAGGLGTRISEETMDKPKPMVKIGPYPIIWHIMKIYSFYHVNDFIICCGYKGSSIKDFFLEYSVADPVSESIDSLNLKVKFNDTDVWNINIVDTGTNSMTGGRLKRVSTFLKDQDCFCFTYGDGLSDININSQIAYHKEHNKLATITAVHPPSRFGALNISKDSRVLSFKEKAEGMDSWINGGFFILSPEVFDLIEGDSTVWEKEPLEQLSESENLMAFKHSGFWQPMDTLREKNQLEDLWKTQLAPWKKWK